LAAAPVPLLEAESGTDRVAITDAGRRVLDGRDDHVALNGVDRWIGGVHVTGDWRWDEGTESVRAR